MSCRSRAKRLRSFSTASSAFSACAETRATLRSIICWMPKIASDAAQIGEGQADAAAPAGDGLAQHDHQGGVRDHQHDRDREREQHHRGDGDVDRGRRADLAERQHHEAPECHQRHEPSERRPPVGGRAIELGPALAQPQPDQHVDGAERDRRRHAQHAPDRVPVLPAHAQGLDEEEQPDRREHGSAAGDRVGQLSGREAVRGGGRHGGHASPGRVADPWPGHTRAVSLLIRQAAPPTNRPSQQTALTTAYQGSSWVSGALATSATPYIGVQ